jgi:hypothetical protein
VPLLSAFHSWRLHFHLPLSLLFLGLAVPARADTCYMTVFGSQQTPNRPAHAHSFAAFVRVACGPEGPQCVEQFAISWLPASLDIDVWALRPECGTNLDLHATLRWVLSDEARVSMWGPFEIKEELYERARHQANRLESGTVRYKAVDTGYPTERVTNCIHAIGDLTMREPRIRIGRPLWGESASYMLVLHLRPWIVNDQLTHPEVADCLRLGCYPIIHRELDRNPNFTIAWMVTRRHRSAWTDFRRDLRLAR